MTLLAFMQFSISLMGFLLNIKQSFLLTGISVVPSNFENFCLAFLTVVNQRSAGSKVVSWRSEGNNGMYREMLLVRVVEQPSKVRSDTKGMSGASSPKTTADCPLVWYRIPFLVPRPRLKPTRQASFMKTSYHAAVFLGNTRQCHLSTQHPTTQWPTPPSGNDIK